MSGRCQLELGFWPQGPHVVTGLRGTESTVWTLALPLSQGVISGKSLILLGRDFLK